MTVTGAVPWRARLSALARLADDPLAVDLFRPDALLTIPGRSEVSGEYRGRSEIAEAFVRLREQSGGTLALELEEPVVVLRRARFTGRMRAHREGASLDEGISVELRLSRSGIRAARLQPDDRRRFDEFWGVRPAVLSPADHDALGRAVRGRSSDADLGWWSRMLVALVAAGVLLWFVSFLQTWRGPSQLAMASHDVTETRRIASIGEQDEAQVGWVLQGGIAGGLDVDGPGGEPVEVVLPVERDEACRALAKVGFEICDAPITPPVTFGWLAPMYVVSTDVERQARVDALDVAASRGKEGWAIGILVRGGDRPSLCFSNPARGEEIEIQAGGERATMPTVASVSCEDGFRLLVAGEAPSVRPSLELRRVASLVLAGSGPELSLEGLNASLGLDPGDAHVVTTRGVVSVTASPADPVRFQVDVGRGPGELASDGPVTSVLTDEGELVPSEWERRPWFWGPIVGGLVTFAVLAPLTSALRTATERLGGFDLGGRLVARSRRRARPSAHPTTGAAEGVTDET